ncbi:MAG: hypothetical protein LBP42_02640 [Treponema sp.]|nr:hypothetical protein [Treponema sp.]
MKTKTARGALILFLLGMAAVFTACEFLMPGDALRAFGKAGLYQIIDGKRVLQETAGEINLANALEIIRQDIVGEPVFYVIVLTKDEAVKPQYLTPLGDRTRGNEGGEGRGKYNYALKDITVEGLNPVTIKLQPAKDRDIPLFVIGTYDEAKVWADDPNRGSITLTLGKNIRVEGSEDNPWPLIQVIAGGSLIIDGAVITGNHRLVDSARSGGGIEIFSGGTLTMNAGEISNHSITLDPSAAGSPVWVGGGGISLNSQGAFVMKGGTITGNTVTNEKGYATGGGILVLDHSSFMMNGGAISENKALSSSYIAHGGGIFLAESSQYILTGGTVSGNEASGAEESKGGGIYAATNTVYTPPQGITLTGNTPDETNSAVSEEENSEEEDEEDADEEEGGDESGGEDGGDSGGDGSDGSDGGDGGDGDGGDSGDE